MPVNVPDRPYAVLDLISVDDHLLEPRETWTARAPARFRDRAPKVVIGPNGTEAWDIEGKLTKNHGLSFMAGMKHEEVNKEQVANFADMRPGCYDPKEHVKDMDLDGVLVSFAFPSTVGFGGEGTLTIRDPELRDWVISTYNDWLAEEYQAAAPGRLYGHGILPLHDPRKSVIEFDRIVKKGVKSITVPGDLENIGDCKPLIHPDFDTLWSRMEESNIPLNVHLAGRFGRRGFAHDLRGREVVDFAARPLGNFYFLGDIIMGEMLERHPRLRIVSSEGGIGWTPYFLERLDEMDRKHKIRINSKLRLKPAEYFHRQCYAAFILDPFGVTARHIIGVDNLLWESDYPHSDTSWPFSHASVDESLKGVSPDERRKITFDNARKVFNLA